MTEGYQEFEFDLPGALLDHLVRALDGLKPINLTPQNLSNIPDAQGVYQLFYDGKLVYIGKTDAEAGLFARLNRHHMKIQHRIGLDPSSISFKAIRIFVFTAIDLETQLIKHYTASGKTAWNGSGFGANDPGRNRDKSKPGYFDKSFPIDIDRELDWDFSGTHDVATVLAKLKSMLPYTLRFETETPSRKAHPELHAAKITLRSGITTPRKLMKKITSQLPKGWQATALASMLILYKETENYPDSSILARSE